MQFDWSEIFHDFYMFNVKVILILHFHINLGFARITQIEK